MLDWRRRLSRAALTLLPKRLRVRVSQRLWDRLNRQSTQGFISHLSSGEWDADEFALVGRRFVEQMSARYDDYSGVPAAQATVVEIGCGIGRFLRPLSDHFSRVIGVDFSEEMLTDAARYCQGIPNIELLHNDGLTLPVPDESADFVVSAGVFQHITVFDAVLSYVREALRVLKPGGLLLFQFEGNRTSRVGFEQTGAKITAAALDQGLRGQPFRIREVSIDPRDPIRNVVCVIERTEAPGRDGFAAFPRSERTWLIGAYDGILTDSQMHHRLEQPPLRLTFYDS